MTRKDFFKRLGMGIGVALIAPSVLSGHPRQEERAPCGACNGTGVNHYSDNDPCVMCDGYGVVERWLIIPDDSRYVINDIIIGPGEEKWVVTARAGNLLLCKPMNYLS